MGKIPNKDKPTKQVNKTQSGRSSEGSRETNTEESIQWIPVQFPNQWQKPPQNKAQLGKARWTSQKINVNTKQNRGRDSSVSIATRYGLDGPGNEFRWGRDFPHPSRPALGPTELPVNGYRVFPGG